MPVTPHARYVNREALCLNLLFVVSRIFIFVFLVGRGSDLSVHRSFIARIVAGSVPFRDFFPEYPPLVFLYTGIPAIFDSSLTSFVPIFRVLSVAVDCIIWASLIRANILENGAFRMQSAGSRESRQSAHDLAHVGQCLLYIVGTTALGSLIYDRIDIALGAIVLFAVCSLLRGNDRGFVLAIGLGIAFKLIPVIFVPMVLAREWTKAKSGLQDGTARPARDAAPGTNLTSAGPAGKSRMSGADLSATLRLLRALALLALPTILSFGEVALLGGYRFDKLIAFHAKRGIHFESVSASVEMVLMMFGVEGHVTSAFGSHNLHTAYENALIAAGTVLLAVTCLASAVIVMRRNMSSTSCALMLCAVLSAALVFSKVLSPQYFLVLLPALAILPVPLGTTKAVANWFLVATMYVLTGLIFPWLYRDLLALQPAAVFVLVARNACLVVLAISLACRAWQASTTRNSVRI